VSLARVSPTDVEAAVDRSLRRLGVDSLDLLQFHWWDYDVPRYVETARALDDLRRKGKIRHLGATNFDTTRLREILDAGVPLIAHQVQYSLVDRRPEGSMAALCGERGLKLLCYGALLGGFFSQSWLDVEEPDEPLENRSLTKYKLVIDEFGGWEAYQRLLGAAAEVARKHATSVSAVGIRWVLDRAAVGAVIVGARDGRHLARTLAAEGLALDAEDRGRLDRAAAGAAGPQGDTYTLERVKGGRHAGIMRYDLNATSGGK
jgi:aryl-alcohol dehydrogenase-like predicted oxidoreductase